MSKLVKNNVDFLKKLGKTKSVKKRNKLLSEANSEQILAILEICINTLKFRVKLTSKQRQKLLTFAEYLRKLSRTRSEKSARKVLQSGDGSVLPALIIPILAHLLWPRE